MNHDYYDLDSRPDPRDPRAAPYYEPSRSPPPSSRYDEPRRGKSERRAPRPRPRSPDYQEPSRRSSRRADPRPPPQVVNGGGRRPLTPPYAADPPKPRRGEGREPRDAREPREWREPRDGREPRQRSDRYSMPPPSKDRDRPRDRDPYAAGGRGPRDDPDFHAGASRRRRSPPPPSRGRDSHEPRHEPRSRGRDYPPPSHDDRYGGGPPPRRARSSARPGDSPPHGRPPPANRSRGAPPPGGGGGGGRAAGMGARVRRNSMPAVNAINRPKINGNPWWQNPTVQAGARNAFTAGAQAAFRNKNDAGPWLGPKGAKVATAALSAAFVDGLIGGQNRGGDR